MNVDKARESQTDYTPWRATKFYVPLVIQALSQSLSYPLVATIVSHGPNGVRDLAAFAQGQMVMFVIGAMGGGLLTAGMVLGRDLDGFRTFKRLNLIVAAALLLAQVAAGLPVSAQFIFGQMLGLEPAMAGTARLVMLWGIPIQACFFLRNTGLVALYNARASAPANQATLYRIASTACLAPFFVRMGWVGPFMGIVAMTGPIVLELILTQWFARPYVRRLEPAAAPVKTAGMREQFAFTLPLSFGGVLLASAGLVVGAFIARAPDPGRMLPAHYVVMGITNPVAFAALRLQAVTLAFPPRDASDNRVFKFALAAGAFLALPTLATQIPAVGSWYFGSIQNMPDADIPLAARATLLITALPVFLALRGHAEGLAAWQRRPNVILAGQATNLCALACMLYAGLALGLPGHLLGVSATLAASVATLATLRAMLSLKTAGSAPK
ncbi:MAG: hypothetical protein LBG65_01975 [Puniceicoccales bacterium]|nr:hypothetical protein [Puniceicoccales bacterium]